MTLAIEAGWDQGQRGSVRLNVERYVLAALTNTYSVNVAYAVNSFRSHSDFSSYLGGSLYSAIQTDIQADLDASSAPVSVSWDIATGAYTFTATGGASEQVKVTFPVDNGTKELLGFSGDSSTAASVSSDQAALYWYLPTGVESEVTEDYEPEDLIYVHRTQGGATHHITSAGVPVHHDFSLRMEAWADVFTWKADQDGGGSHVGHTLQEIFEHCRGKYPFLVTHDFGSAVHRFRPEEAFFEPERVHPEENTYWSVPFRTYVTRE